MVVAPSGHAWQPETACGGTVTRLSDTQRSNFCCALHSWQAQSRARAPVCVLPFASTRRPPLAPPCSVCSCRGGSKRLHRCKLPPAQHVPNELTESFDHWEGRFLRDLSSHRRRSVRGGRLGLVKGCPHVLHAAWLWSPPTTPGSLKPHVEEPLRVCRILNARTSVALCIRGKRKAEHARPCVCSRSRQSGTTYERASANRLRLRADRWRQLQYRRPSM